MQCLLYVLSLVDLCLVCMALVTHKLDLLIKEELDCISSSHVRFEYFGGLELRRQDLIHNSEVLLSQLDWILFSGCSLIEIRHNLVEYSKGPMIVCDLLKVDQRVRAFQVLILDM